MCYFGSSPVGLSPIGSCILSDIPNLVTLSASVTAIATAELAYPLDTGEYTIVSLSASITAAAVTNLVYFRSIGARAEFRVANSSRIVTLSCNVVAKAEISAGSYARFIRLSNHNAASTRYTNISSIGMQAIGVRPIGAPAVNIVDLVSCEFTASNIANVVTISASMVGVARFIDRDVYAPNPSIFLTCTSSFIVQVPRLLVPDLSNRIICVRGDERIIFIGG